MAQDASVFVTAPSGALGLGVLLVFVFGLSPCASPALLGGKVVGAEAFWPPLGPTAGPSGPCLPRAAGEPAGPHALAVFGLGIAFLGRPPTAAR
eukprot:13972619-Alexandrium_andersonii.AAC.1